MEPNQPTAPAPTPVSVPMPDQNASLAKIEGPISLLKSGWRLFKEHWKVLVPIMILPTVISYIGTLLGFTDSIGMKIIGILVVIVSVVFSIAMVPALVNAIHKLSSETSPTITLKEQYRFGFKSFWSIILIGLIYGFVGIGSTILFLIPGIVVCIYASVYMFTFVIDGKRGFSVLTESYSLIKGRWWPVLGRVLFLALAMCVSWIIILAVVSLIGKIFGAPVWTITPQQNIAASSSVGLSLVSFVANLIGTSVLGTIAMGYSYRMYQSLKTNRVIGVSTAVFKKWLVAFLCVGIAAVVIMTIALPILLATSLRSAVDKAREAGANAAARQAEIQKIIDRELGTSSPRVQ